MADAVVGHYIDEYQREATSLVQHIEQVSDHYKKGDLQAACTVASITHYNLSRLMASREGIVNEFGRQGIEPDQGESAGYSV